MYHEWAKHDHNNEAFNSQQQTCMDYCENMI